MATHLGIDNVLHALHHAHLDRHWIWPLRSCRIHGIHQRSHIPSTIVQDMHGVGLGGSDHDVARVQSTPNKFNGGNTQTHSKPT
jgi:hypothetical protein